MKKTDSEVVDTVVGSTSAPIFGTPIPYEVKTPRKTIMVCVVTDVDGSHVVHKCIEDVMKDVIPLRFEETTLNNLRDKGVEPHALVGKMDSQRLGADSGFDALADTIINNASRIVTTSKSE